MSLPARAPVLSENPVVPPAGFFPATLAANDASSSINDVESSLGIPDLARMRPATAEIRIWDSIAQVVEDVLLLAANLYVLSYLVFLFGPPSKVANSFTTASPVSHAEVLRILFLFVTLTVLLFNMGRLYQFTRTRSALGDCQTIGWATLFATVLVSGFNYVSGTRVFPEKIIILTGLLNMATLSGWRLLKRRRDGRLPKPSSERNVLIVGAGGTGRRLAQFLEQNRQLGYRFRGFLDKDARPDSRVLGKIEQLPQVARAYFIDEVIITGLAHRQQLSGVVSAARRHRLDIKVVPDFYTDLCNEQNRTTPVEYVGDYPLLVLHQQPIPALSLFLKRSLDILIASLSLLLVSPLMAAIAIAIKFDSPGPVLYLSRRLGKKGRGFRCFKFRTMQQGSDVLKDRLRKANERQGPFFKMANDPRITPFGRFLRKYSLDELPQLWNVLKGDMSIVGPRPHPIDDCKGYRLDHLRRLDVTPGITGLWQVSSRRDPSFDKNMLLDLQYIENWSLWQDIRILLKTLPAVLRGEGQ